MAATVAQLEPSEIQAGNTLRFDKILDDYPAGDGWVLTYVLRSRLQAVESITITATADGDDHEINVAAATTANWTPGDYTMVGYVTLAPDRYEIFRQQFKVTPDIASTDLPYDGRSYYERLLQQVRDMIENGAVREVIRYSFNGVTTEVLTLADAFKAEAWLASKVQQEKSAGKQRKILTRFVSPR